MDLPPELVATIDLLPDGSVYIQSEDGEVLFPAGSFEAEQYRGAMGHLGSTIDIDQEHHQLKMM